MTLHQCNKQQRSTKTYLEQRLGLKYLEQKLGPAPTLIMLLFIHQVSNKTMLYLIKLILKK